MKKLYRTILATTVALFSVSASAQVSETVLDVMTDYEAYKSNDQYIEYQNEDYVLMLDLNEVPAVGKTYTMDNSADNDYNAVKCKNEVIQNKYGTYEWKKYLITDLSLTFTQVDVKNKVFKANATVVAKNDNDVIRLKFVYNAPSPISFTLTGQTDYNSDLKVYSLAAKNKGSELKDDYSINLDIKATAYDKGTITATDLYGKGNKIKMSSMSETSNIKTANLTVETSGDSHIVKGDITDAAGNKYKVELTTNIPSKEPKAIEVDLGAVLTVSTDEGDIKFKAQTAEHEFIGFITCNTTDVPSGTYPLLSYSKYGDYMKAFDFYNSDRFDNGQIVVVNNNGNISITATFKQNGKNYSVKASTFTTAISNATVTPSKAVTKYLENGKIVIVKNGKKYGVDAAEIK